MAASQTCEIAALLIINQSIFITQMIGSTKYDKNNEVKIMKKLLNYIYSNLSKAHVTRDIIGAAKRDAIKQ